MTRGRRARPPHRTEWALLDALSEHPGKLLTQRWLLERVWGPGYEDDVEVLRVFVSQLRKKIEPDPSRPRIIVTDPGVGYRWALRPSAPAWSVDLVRDARQDHARLEQQQPLHEQRRLVVQEQVAPLPFTTTSGMTTVATVSTRAVNRRTSSCIGGRRSRNGASTTSSGMP